MRNNLCSTCGGKYFAAVFYCCLHLIIRKMVLAGDVGLLRNPYNDIVDIFFARYVTTPQRPCAVNMEYEKAEQLFREKGNKT